MRGLTVALTEVGLSDVSSVGGKAANLGELSRMGLAVPRGFVITTRGFCEAAERFDPGGTIAARIGALSPDDQTALAAVAEAIRQQVRSVVMPDLAEEIGRRYDSFGHGEDVAVAVRSSAIGEDSSEDSFAGLQDTYLYVRGREALASAVMACYASLYSVESVSYRLRRHIPEAEAAMAVVVQAMVDARSSGVLFTRSPATGDRSVVAVESAWGLGSSVVSGTVTPDSFLLSKVTGEILRRRISAKENRDVRRDDGAGVVTESVPAELRNVPSLSEEELGRLLELALAIESHFGAAQDVEWAIAPDLPAPEDLVVLQARPETAWSKRDAVALAAPKPRDFDHVLDRMGRS